MNLTITAATARRVATQLRRDPSTLALLLIVPAVLMILCRYLFPSSVFGMLGAVLLAVVPFTIMFAVTAVTTLRERTAGTLERVLAMPATKLVRVAKGGQQSDAGLIGHLLRGQVADCLDGPPELVEISFAALAGQQVVDETVPGAGVECVVEERGHQLNELVAVEACP